MPYRNIHGVFQGLLLEKAHEYYGEASFLISYLFLMHYLISVIL